MFLTWTYTVYDGLSITDTSKGMKASKLAMSILYWITRMWKREREGKRGNNKMWVGVPDSFRKWNGKLLMRDCNVYFYSQCVLILNDRVATWHDCLIAGLNINL